MAELHVRSVLRSGTARYVLAAFLLACGGALLVQGEEPQPPSVQEGPPVPIELYVSGTDPAAPAIRHFTAEVLKKFPRLKLREIDIDTDEGRAARERMEKDHHIKHPGEATLCIGPYHLINRADDKEIQTYFPYFAARIFDPEVGHGRLEPDPLPFARRVFGETIRLTAVALPDLEKQRVFTVLKDDRPVGWVADLYRATRCPFCNDAQFLVALDPDRSIRAVECVRPIERHAKDVDAEEVQGFVKQFLGRKPAADLQVDGVVGATWTCGAYRVNLQELWQAFERHEKSRGATDKDSGKAPEH